MFLRTVLVRLRARDHGHLRSLLMRHVWKIAELQGTETMISMAEMPRKLFQSEILEQMPTHER